ncbi:hypothetical protein [Mucilaginibacter aquariorum]|uniref:DUF1292 domain-containing protein n=1 Tax=Mucilaginibacter aquariorum TaxID=2967225 RepID=A0ABT1SXK9_9SPHI|nr:hypothetical protein [Mucilaginibacter aquariorum]MCQ6957074.1 hypothetical protein [Mucilaginibacter aquariorum]
MTSFEMTRTDGSKLYIEIDPATYENDGNQIPSSVYQLQATRFDDPAGTSTEDNPGDTTEIGTFAHRDDDKFDWVYLGEFLDDEEQAQVAAFLQGYESERSNDVEGQ